ncbi:hypothetical protein MNBD_GAMMA01-1298 [hydrothermal vent metagenome]|uniref:Helix-turn-helix domain-containing protein n=1 Tax=hydrothermal vent metagenome TaxID=652676 RepID=A0A3B0VKL4_9ZZZZ
MTKKEILSKLTNELLDCNRTECVVYMYLALLANKDNQCWPSYETIMSSCKIRSRNVVSETIKSLEKKRHIKKRFNYNPQTKQRHKNTYTIC